MKLSPMLCIYLRMVRTSPNTGVQTVPTVIEVNSSDDPRLSGYTRLKEHNLSREGGRFTAESEKVVRQAAGLAASSIGALRTSPARSRRCLPLVPEGTSLYVADAGVVNDIVGFKFHSGVMAVGFRGRQPVLEEVAGGWGDRPLTLMILPEVNKTDNLGALIRIAAGFGAGTVLLGEHAATRSTGSQFESRWGPSSTSPSSVRTICWRNLRCLHERFSVELVATILANDAESLASAGRGRRSRPAPGATSQRG